MWPGSGITPSWPVWKQRKQRKDGEMPARRRNGADGNWKNSRPLTEQQGKNTEAFQDCQKRHQARGRVVFCRFSSRFSSNNIACFRLSICESFEARRQVDRSPALINLCRVVLLLPVRRAASLIDTFAISHPPVVHPV